MNRIARLSMVMVLALVVAGQAYSQKGDIGAVVAHKWKVIWYSDDGDEKNMEAKKQQLLLREDGSGEMSMMGQKVGDVKWTVAKGKDRITFQDDPLAEPYLVKVSKYKGGLNMLFTGTLPNGVVRKVYFERLLGN